MALLLAGPAAAHGAFVDVEKLDAVGIQARYDTGAAMAGAQVAVFAPDNPAQPWLTGMTDADGRFVFAPDDRPGRWAVQVRQAGHGAIGYLEIGADGVASAFIAPATAAGLTWTQRALMIASVLWGCIGTALYFRPTRRIRQA
ncbi:carboxypeptidase-like regulatory domain-containing protein [Yoonia vestfoldensis]|uniref:carboxypeptidase-like regulatory domain-containing protein n=1 Tax=Yoonia vestfoldensis TaxID=245188 RepID=UPI000375A87E|nr:carboxypeptidase-like regulatory domain-containing protein [Yoonia vestfoldensis]